MYNKHTILQILLAVICTSCIFIACKKEDALTSEKVYSGSIKLPQGACIYDSSIQNFYNATGTYITYQFDNQSDLRFFMKGIPGIGTMIPPSVFAVQVDTSVQAEKDTLNMAVNYLINELLRKTYPNKLLHQLLPYKILLYKYGRALYNNSAKSTGYDTATVAASLTTGMTANGLVTSANNLVEGFNCLGLGIVRKYNGLPSSNSFSFPTGYTAAQKKIFHQFLWTGIGGTAGSAGSPASGILAVPLPAGTNGAIGKGRIPVPASFNLTDYGILTSQLAAIPYDAFGRQSNNTIDSVCVNNGMLLTARIAAADYIEYITKIASISKLNFDTTYIQSVITGQIKDTKGLRAKKRDAIVTFFKNEYDFNIENCWNN